MVQSTNPPQLDDLAHRAGLDGTRLRAVIGEPLMGPIRVVVAKKFVEGPSQVGLVPDVAGFTITRACCHFGQSRRSATHSIRSERVSRGRFVWRWSTASWWRSATISSATDWRDRKNDRVA